MELVNVDTVSVRSYIRPISIITSAKWKKTQYYFYKLINNIIGVFVMKKNYYFLLVAICVLIINFTAQFAFAQWTTNVAVNTPICTADTFQ